MPEPAADAEYAAKSGWKKLRTRVKEHTGFANDPRTEARRAWTCLRAAFKLVLAVKDAARENKEHKEARARRKADAEKYRNAQMSGMAADFAALGAQMLKAGSARKAVRLFEKALAIPSDFVDLEMRAVVLHRLGVAHLLLHDKAAKE